MQALVLSGGGSRGAFQVGVAKSLYQGGLRPDLVTGVSVGAFNSFFLAQGQVFSLEQLWLKIRDTSDVYSRRWLAAPLIWLGWQWGYPSLYKPGPFSKILKHKIKAARKADFVADLRVGAVDLVSGKYTSVDHTHPNLEKFIAASMSVPMAFPPVKIKDKKTCGVYVDGCIRNLTPLGEAIAAGADDIYVVLADSSDIQPKKVSFRKYDQIVARVVDIALHEVLIRDIKNVLVRNELADLYKDHPNDKIRNKYRKITLHFYEPKAEHVLPGLLDFDPKSIKQLIQIGEEVGKNGVCSDKFLNELVSGKSRRFLSV